MKIGIAGIGGVGGYIGTRLAICNDEVYFLARGERLNAIKQNGISMNSDYHGINHAIPKLVSDNAKELGIMDILFLCVKDYSLEQACSDIMPMIDDDTIVVPVMNGVCAAAKTEGYIKKGIVLESVIYIVAFAAENGLIRHIGEARRLHLGTTKTEEKYKAAVKLTAEVLNAADIVCITESDIEAAIWKKYILNCAYNITTAYYNEGIGAMFTDSDREYKTRKLLEEASSVARAKNINISPNIEDEFMEYFKSLPYESGSSLQRDMQAGRKNEMDIFLGELLRQGKGLGLNLFVSEYFYEQLNEKKTMKCHENS